MPGPNRLAAAFTMPRRRALRIVLCGLPGAGKSSLLGALAVAAKIQEAALNFRLDDTGQVLVELEQHLAEGLLHETSEKADLYPVALEPLAGRKPGDRAGRLEVLLIDCAGQSTRDLLSQMHALDDGKHAPVLAREILQSDALLLVIDASVRSAQAETTFDGFASFLGTLEQNRRRRVEVGGLPVFLVLTKCDLLAEPKDTFTDWIDRIEEEKRRLASRFQKFLLRPLAPPHAPLAPPHAPLAPTHPQSPPPLAPPHAPLAPPPPPLAPPHAPLAPPHPPLRERGPGGEGFPAASFGGIRLHLWATAVKHPVLEDSPGQPQTPYGVAELFRQCFDQARAHRKRRERSGRRLLWISAGSILVVAGLALFSILLLAGRSSNQTGALEAKIDRYQAREQDRSLFAQHRRARNRIEELTAFQKDPDFANLPFARKDYVEHRLGEMTAYLEFETRLNALLDPRSARRESQLREIAEGLERLTIPVEYGAEWSQTEAGRRLVGWSGDVRALAREVRIVYDGYEKVIRDGKQVLADSSKPLLPTRAQKVLDAARDLPGPQNAQDKIPGSDRVTYATVFGFDSVSVLMRQWEDKNNGIRGKLESAASLRTP